MRIVHLGKYYHPFPGGIESHVRTLAHAQARLGHAVSVVAIAHDDTQRRALRHETDGPLTVVRVQRQFTLAKLDVCPALPALLGQLAEADVLHLHVPNPMAIAALLAAGMRRLPPVVVTYHSDHVRQRIAKLLVRPLEHWLYARVALILATSPVYAGGSDLLVQYTDRLAVLPHGIDLAPLRDPTPSQRHEADALRRRYGHPLWLCVGRLIYYKGIATALAALVGVRGTLLIAGDGPDHPQLARLATSLGVAERVVWLGRVADLTPLYWAADALWFPSNARSEAFGLVQVEAMAAARPVINTAIPHSGVAWVSLHEQTGLTVPPNDPTALAAAANRLADDPALAARWGLAGQARAAAEFDHHVMAARSVAFYQRAISQNPRRHA